MELKEGMYVRTKDDGIQKITKITQNNCFYRTCTAGFEYKTSLFEDDIIGTPSFDIKDLIEVGDYVNGYEVTSKDQFLGFGNHDWYMLDNEIKSIVTKEQFESMSYKVGD